MESFLVKKIFTFKNIYKFTTTQQTGENASKIS